MKKDYNISEINNSNGKICSSYPNKIFIQLKLKYKILLSVDFGWLLFINYTFSTRQVKADTYSIFQSFELTGNFKAKNKKVI